MVFLQRNTGSNHHRKRPLPSSPPPSPPPPLTPSDPHVDTMISLLAEAGCTLRGPQGAPPCLPSDDPHRIRHHLERRLSADPALLSSFLSGFSAYIQSQSDLHRVLIPASQDNRSLVRILLSIPSIQPQIQQMLLEKLPEHFADLSQTLSLKDDIARLIINQFRWLDFLINPTQFSEKLMEVLSIAPCRLKREIVGLLPEIVGDESHSTIVPALEQLLSEDSDLVVPVLDSLSDLNLDEELQEQAVTIAISCIRTVEQENMPHLLRFLLLAANQENVRRIISQIRENLKFSAPIDKNALRNKKLKGKCTINSTDAAILDALRSSLRFKNMICEAILKELKSIDKPQYHKSVDIWFLILIYANGGVLQKSCEKLIKRKIIQGLFQEALFDQCINGHKELVKDHFSSFLSLSILDYLEGFNEDNLRKVYDIFCHLALCDRANKDSGGSKIGNELLMIVRKQVSNPDMKYKKMGIIGTLRKSHSEEALELLKMAINSCKIEGLALILLYDELVSLLDKNNLQPTILDWIGFHAGEFESQFIADLKEGQLTTNHLSDGIEEKLTNEGSLGGIDALLGCPIHLPSPRVNAFSTQVGTVDFVTQKTKNDMAIKLLKRLKNLILLEGLLNTILETLTLSLPALIYSPYKPNSNNNTIKHLNPNSNLKKRGRKPKSETQKEKEESNNKSNSDGKNLKQPTILDVFRKAGVSVSQDSANGSLPGVMLNEYEGCEIGHVDLGLVPVQLELQRGNFRPLLPVSLSLLAFSFTESGDSCCSDPQAELPIYLYILRDLNIKLDSTDCEILTNIRPLFGYLRKHFDNAFSMLKDGFESCSDHWTDSSCSAANPVLSFVTVSKPNIANSVFREILSCYRKVIILPFSL
ncbi:hypothetical protein LUZ60_010295 [Juncus effusus]|nr:hypothetical protein LUZ60_010295 [Juncus effusus]